MPTDHYYRMYDIDREKIKEEQQKIYPYEKTTTQIMEFMEVYVPDINVRYGKLKNTLLKYLLSDNTLEKVDTSDPQMIRAWLTLHRNDFLREGINLPEYPLWIDKLLQATS